MPINDATNNFNVIVPNNVDLNFDTSGEVAGISFGSNGSMNFANGQSFVVDGVAVLNSNVFADGVGSVFSALGSVGDLPNNARVRSLGGASVSVGALDYNSTGNVVAIEADGENSTVNMSNLGSITNTADTFSNNIFARFVATNGGLVNLSGLQSIDGGFRDGNFGGTTRNLFEISNGGMMDLTSLQTVSQLNQFDIDIDSFQFPSLEQFGSTIWNLGGNTNLDTPSLTNVSGTAGPIRSQVNFQEDSRWTAAALVALEDMFLNTESGGAIELPELTVFENSTVFLNSDVDFMTGVLSSIDDSEIHVIDDVAFEIPVQEYARTRNGSITALKSDGESSSISLPNLSAISSSSTNGFTSFVALNGGFLDLSSVMNIDGGSQAGRNRFELSTQGFIDFSNLERIEEQNQFDINIPAYSLPSLLQLGGTNLNLSTGVVFSTPILETVSGSTSSVAIPIFSTWEAPLLTSLNDINVSLEVGGTLDAPNVSSFQNSSVSLQPGIEFIVANLTSIDNSRFSVAGGEVLRLHAVSFNRDRIFNNDAFRANGPNSAIIAEDLTSITNTTPLPTGFIVSITNFIAENGGLIDFANLNFV